MKTFVLGDIHGAHKALLQVLERSGFDYNNDRLISIGDVVDGWPETAECVEELLKVKDLIAIRGNHDQWAYEALVERVVPEYWFEWGGKATIDSYKRMDLLNDKRHKNFFKDQVNYYVDTRKRLFVHAGYNPAERIEKQLPLNLYMNRHYWRYIQRAHHDETERITDCNGFTEVFIGHTQTLKEMIHDQPVRFHNCWNVDQGAKSTGRLTIMDVNTHEYWQSDPVFTLYPDFI